MTFDELQTNCAGLGIVLSEEAAEKLKRYCGMLQEWNQKMNLTAITDTEAVIEKHFYDCILPLCAYDIRGRIADVGSGAGFPGIVWKIVREDLDITLIEPTGKRCTFLNAVIDELGLTGIRAVNKRSADNAKNHREEYDAVTARAVANLSVLTELCVPLIRVSGIFAAMKGSNAQAEHEAAHKAFDTLHCELAKTQAVTLPCGEERINLFYVKKKQTPPKYPRPYGQIKKKPL